MRKKSSTAKLATKMVITTICCVVNSAFLFFDFIFYNSPILRKAKYKAPAVIRKKTIHVIYFISSSMFIFWISSCFQFLILLEDFQFLSAVGCCPELLQNSLYFLSTLLFPDNCNNLEKGVCLEKTGNFEVTQDNIQLP